MKNQSVTFICNHDYLKVVALVTEHDITELREVEEIMHHGENVKTCLMETAIKQCQDNTLTDTSHEKIIIGMQDDTYEPILETKC